jgi:hypothetical protein
MGFYISENGVPSHRRETIESYTVGGVDYLTAEAGDLPFLHYVLAGSEIHPTSYIMGAEGLSPRRQSAKLTTHLHYALRLRIVELHFHSLQTYLHGTVLEPTDTCTFRLRSAYTKFSVSGDRGTNGLSRGHSRQTQSMLDYEVVRIRIKDEFSPYGGSLV